MSTDKLKAISQGVSGAAFAAFALYLMYSLIRLTVICWGRR